MCWSRHDSWVATVLHCFIIICSSLINFNMFIIILMALLVKAWACFFPERHTFSSLYPREVGSTPWRRTKEKLSKINANEDKTIFRLFDCIVRTLMSSCGTSSVSSHKKGHIYSFACSQAVMFEIVADRSTVRMCTGWFLSFF